MVHLPYFPCKTCPAHIARATSILEFSKSRDIIRSMITLGSWLPLP